MVILAQTIKKVTTPSEMLILFGVFPLLLRVVINTSGVQSQSTTCQEGWTEYGNHCYWSQSGLLKSWEDAQNVCQSNDSNLVKIETPEENSWLKTLTTASVWIGANDRDKEGDWRWIADNSEVTFSNWAPNEPNNVNDNEHCVHTLINEPEQWNDLPCASQLEFICEKEGFLTAPLFGRNSKRTKYYQIRAGCEKIMQNQ